MSQNELEVHTFGSCTIKGEISLIGSLGCKNINSFLYFNRSMKYFFFVKYFASGKCHTDFFKLFDYQMKYLEDAYGEGEYKVASCKNNDIYKELFYDYNSGNYIVKSYKNNEVFVSKIEVM